ncbi:LOW QUALITY PROTEIN: uncharacterized protein [Amphiura filiformis]|uniref:LOW QUALITY PROTEIN: uncharacterized protein n=1 Tax=Amphiura filiformis TaxID=82378 RepID=UPI003B213FC1
MFWKFVLVIVLCLSWKVVASQDGTAETPIDWDPSGGSMFDSNETVLLCNNTHVCAGGGCQSNTTACNCDDYCHFFNDCCKDVSSCNGLSAQGAYPGLVELGIGTESIGCITPVLSSDTSTNFAPDDYYYDGASIQYSNYYSYNEDASLPGVYMIDKCPDVRSEFAPKCQEHNTTDIQSVIPITEANYGISFKNVYCALCNKISLKDIRWWKLLAQCDEDILPLIEDSLAHGISLAETLRVINKFCPISFEPTDSFTSQIGSRRCYPTLKDFNSCASNARQDFWTGVMMIILLVTDDGGKFYRNPYCFLCSKSNLGDDFDIELDCYNENIPLISLKSSVSSFESDIYFHPIAPDVGGPGHDLRPISVIVDFTSNSGVSVQVRDTVITIEKVNCEEGQVYDPFADQCRTLSCSEGFSLIGNECVSIRNGCKNNLKSDLKISYANCDNNTAAIAEAKQCIEKLYIPANVSIVSTKHGCTNIDGKDIGHFIFKMKSTEFASFIDLEQTFDGIFAMREGSLDPCNTTGFTLSITCSPKVSECVNQISLSNVSIERSENVTFITSRDTKYFFSEGTVSIQYALHGEIPAEGTKTIHADICDTIHFACSLITLNSSLFTNVTNDSLLYQPTGELFMKDEYIFTTGGQIQVCSFLDKNGTRNSTQIITFLAYDQAQIILSLIGCIVSLIALAVTFVTFCVFSHLRTRAIKAIMNLVAALFTAQLVFLVGAGSTSNTNFCTFIAVLLHYLWLCTFTWSNVLAYDLNKTFSSKMTVSYQERNTPILKYLIYGWVTPIAVVVPCLVIQYCSDIPFQYGNQGVCWIYNQYANLVAFGVPLVLCLVINIALFLKTAWNIHVTKQNTKMVQRNSRLKSVNEELLIYIKIATLMGFTWIFAFSAAFSGVAALWYIYIIINSLQGLYIFFAFTFNVRIGRLWANKVHLTYFDDSVVEKSGNKTSGKTTQSSLLPDSESNMVKQKVLPGYDDNKEGVSTV